MKKIIFLTTFLPLLAYGQNQEQVQVSCKVLFSANEIKKTLSEEEILSKNGTSDYYGFVEVYKDNSKRTETFGIKIKFLKSCEVYSYFDKDTKIKIATPNGVKISLVDGSNGDVKDFIILQDYSKSEPILSYSGTTDPNVVPKIQIQCVFKTIY